MDFFGLDLNPRTSWPTVEQWQELQPGWARFKHFTMDETKAALMKVPQWCGIILLADGETEGVGSDLSGWRSVCEDIRDEIGPEIDIFESLNEPDLLGVSSRKTVECAAQAKEIIGSVGPRVIIGGLAGQFWRDYAQECAALFSEFGPVDGIGYHPYGENPEGFTLVGGGFGQVKENIEWINRVTNLPVYLTECGCKIRDAGNADGVASYLAAMVDTIASIERSICALGCWFCLDDSMGSPGETGEDAFGLMSYGEKRSAYFAFQEAASRYPKG